MDSQNNLLVRYPTEAKLLKHALNRDSKVVKRILYYLGSANPVLCQIMQKAIHDLRDSRIWHQLLKYLALHQWDEYVDRDQYFDLDRLERIDQAIIEIFTWDDHEWEKLEKETVLLAYLDDTDPSIRQACTYLLAVRGYLQAIPILTDTIKNGTRKWQLRAIKALEILNDARCAPPLLMALIMDRDELHREARRALHALGPLAKSVWIEALNHPDDHIRWEAARGLGQMGDVRAIEILARGLLDESYAVRWATSDVLAHLGSQAIPAILTVLSRDRLNEQSRNAACHSLHGTLSASTKEYIKPLLDALNGPEPDIDIPIMAQRLLSAWETTDEKKSKQKQKWID